MAVLAQTECATTVTAALCYAHIFGNDRICEQLICALLDCALLDERLPGALHKILYLYSGDALLAACHGYHRLLMARELLLLFFE